MNLDCKFDSFKIFINPPNVFCQDPAHQLACTQLPL